MSWRALGRCDRITRSPATVAVISRVIRGPLSFLREVRGALTDGPRLAAERGTAWGDTRTGGDL